MKELSITHWLQCVGMLHQVLISLDNTLISILMVLLLSGGRHPYLCTPITLLVINELSKRPPTSAFVARRFWICRQETAGKSQKEREAVFTQTSTIQKKRKGRSRKNISLSDNDEPPQPDHINSVDVSQNIRSGEVVMANKELELKWLMAEGGELWMIRISQITAAVSLLRIKTKSRYRPLICKKGQPTRTCDTN